MEISRFLKPELIKLEMITSFETEEEEETEPLSERKMLERKREILSECVELLDLSGKVSNKNKLLIDLFNREKKATTAIGKGIVIPHVRTMQARELIIAVCRSTAGYDFDAPDKELAHIFVPMAAPPYDDTLYLRVFRSLAQIFSADSFYERIMAAEAPYDVVRVFQELE